MLDVWISAVNGVPDDNPENDLKSKDMSVYSHAIARKPAFEEFTSSTCAPCASFNTSFNPWCETHAEDITLIKYQMNWPSPGDPYYTAEGGVRRDYYGVSYVPWPQCNGAYVDYSIGAVQAAYDNAILQPGLAKIASSHTINGTVIDVNTSILPFAGFTDFDAYIVVVEKITTGNVSSNGETSFHNVMMKMIPDAYGTTLDLNDRETVTLTESVDLASTNIEEYSDLAVVILFQDNASKEIFQSEYSIENGSFATEASVVDISYDGIPVPGFSPDVFDYEILLPEGTTEIPVVEATPAESGETVIVVPTWVLPGTTVVDAFAEDLVTRKTYNIHFSVEVGIDDPAVKSDVMIFPNPANNRIFVKGIEKADISIFSITGQQVMTVNSFDGNSIDVSSLQNGIYTIQIKEEGFSVVTRKITILR